MSNEKTFTRLQLEEIRHKLSILCDEPELQESYNLTAEQANDMFERYQSATPKQPVTVLEIDIPVLLDELENCCDIADANIAGGDPDLVPSMVSYRTSIRAAIAKLR